MNCSSPNRSFVLLCLVSLALSWHILFGTCALALQNDAYTHILLILPISVGLIFVEWTSRTALLEPNFRTGSAVMALGVLIGFFGGAGRRGSSLTADMQLSIGMLALVIWWIGAFVCCFGTRLCRRCIFPLYFLLWLVPLPQFALNRIVSFLQQGSASVADLLLSAAGVAVAHDGVVLSLPGLTLEVAKECSSIRSSLMLIVTAMVMAHLLLRSTLGKVVVSLVAIPLSVVKNGVRVFTLGLLGAYIDPAYLHGRLHHNGGIVFFLLGVIGLFAVLGLVRHIERKITPQAAFESAAFQTTPPDTLTKSLARR